MAWRINAGVWHHKSNRGARGGASFGSAVTRAHLRIAKHGARARSIAWRCASSCQHINAYVATKTAARHNAPWRAIAANLAASNQWRGENNVIST